MVRKFGVGLLILSFGLSNLITAGATEVVEVQPVVVNPNDFSDLNEQMLAQDRINRDQELAIRGLIDDNQKLTNTALARQQDDTLEKINQTMGNYRDFLLARDRQRVMDNTQQSSKYYDLIRLTEDVDDAKDWGKALQLKSETIEEKYRTLTDLKNEMMELNTKLREEEAGKNFEKIDNLQEQKIQVLTQRLTEMDQKIARYDAIIIEKDQQIAQLKEELARVQNEVTLKDVMIQEQKNQISILQGKPKNYTPSSIENMALAPIIVNGPSANMSFEAATLRNKILQQSKDLKQANETIRWLNQVLGTTKNKAEYYRLSSQQDQMTMQQVQGQVQNIRNSFAQHFDDYNQFEQAIVSLKSQISRLGRQLSLKQKEIDFLKSDDRLHLAKKLIDLQNQEASLLGEKDNLRVAQNNLFEQHVADLDSKIKGLLHNRQIQAAAFESRIQELQNQLSQNEGQIGLLKSELESKIAQEKNQGLLAQQIQDLKTQLQAKDDQIAAMKADIQNGKQTKEEADALRQQLATQQDNTDQLKQELENKVAESNKLTLMVDEYQKKLESKDISYNQQLKQILSTRKNQSFLEKQITYLNTRLQEKEAQVVKIKNDMYDLQESYSAKDKSVQAKDLSLSMIQQKMMDEKINEYQEKVNGLQASNDKQLEEVTNLRNELALVRQQFKGVPSNDEVEFLRTGLKKATAQLKQKDAVLAQIKAQSAEYAKEFKKQIREFQSLKDQLQDAYDDINHKDEDLKYKNLEILRLKEQSTTGVSDLQHKVMILSRMLEATEKRLMSKTHENRAMALAAQLKIAQLKIKDLQGELNHTKTFSKDDPYGEKLKQALDKIDEQGRMINALVQKLQDAGQPVNLTHLEK